MLAAQHGFADIVRTLILEGRSKPGELDTNARSAIMLAAQAGHVQVTAVNSTLN